MSAKYWYQWEKQLVTFLHKNVILILRYESTQVYDSQIAAASLEKLFQQLTSPHNFQDDFIDVRRNTE